MLKINIIRIGKINKRVINTPFLDRGDKDMRPLYEMSVIQIEVTNACNHRCANCTRLVGHHKKPFFMDLDTIKKAIESLDGFPGNIGLMGGEPALHPKFSEICQLYQDMIPDKRRRQLWTSGYKWDEYEEIIKETFDTDLIVYNEHKSEDEGWHQPILISADEIIEDKDFMWKLIDNCWVQKRWSASITPKGTYFCEVAAAIDILFDGPGGWPIEKGWWDKTPQNEQFQEQVKRLCVKCSAAIPLNIPSSHMTFDLVSVKNAEILKKVQSPKFLKNQFKIYDKKYTYDDYLKNYKTWAPGRFRNFIQHEPDVKISHA